MGLALLSHIRGDTVGGAELVLAEVAKIFRHAGYDVICFFGTSYDQEKDRMGFIKSGIKVINANKTLERILSNRDPRSRSVLTLNHARFFAKAVKDLEPDIVFLDHEAFNLLKCLSRKTRIIHYVHFPYEYVPDPFDVNFMSRVFRIIGNKYIISKDNFSDKILSNSIFTRNECIKRWKREDCATVYPPVDTGQIIPSPIKEETCIVLSRISPEKNIEIAIEAFENKLLKDKKLIIAGYVSADRKSYFEKLTATVKRSNNVTILPNLERREILDLLSKSKVFLHPMNNEHFGIAVVEAMSAGCIPIVHNSGGPVEIVEGDKYGLTFSVPSDLPMILDRAFSLSANALHQIERAKVFDKAHFRQQIISLLR